jgi:hypothetical protein
MLNFVQPLVNVRHVIDSNLKIRNFPLLQFSVNYL